MINTRTRNNDTGPTLIENKFQGSIWKKVHSSDAIFYKYLSPNAAVALLKNKQFKWSSPRLFNDPFDFPCDIDVPFNAADLAARLLEELVNLIYGDAEPDGEKSNFLFSQAIIARHNPKNPSENVFRDFMKSSIIETAEQYLKNREELRDYFRNSRDQYAVLCLSEVHNDILMWAHYAEKHTGCVLKLRCLPAMDRPLCMAKKVVYQSKYPLRTASLEDYVKHLTGQMTLNGDKLFETFALTKSCHWRYEKEWRCIDLLSDSKIEAGYDYDPLVPEELEGVYLGCKIDDTVKENILQLINNDFPFAIVYQSKIDTQKFRLRFDRIR